MIVKAFSPLIAILKVLIKVPACVLITLKFANSLALQSDQACQFVLQADEFSDMFLKNVLF